MDLLQTKQRYAIEGRLLEDFVRALNSALQIQGLALLCTAINQTFRKQLTLFHAICVLHLLSLLGFGLTSRGKYGHQGRYRLSVLWTAKILIAGAFVSFLAYVWATAPRFGSQPECNASTAYVIFWVNINATNIVFRYAILVLMVLAVTLAVMNGLVGGLTAAWCCGIRDENREVRSGDLAAMITILSRVQIRERRIKWALQQQNLGDGILRTLVNVYGIVMLELTVHRNNLSSEEQGWTFGQILAIFLLLGVVAEVLNVLLAKLDSKPEKTQPDVENVAMEVLPAT
ncbi:MAG: hypothetical protein Q9213_002879 [Squamulea squamosa]